MSSEERQLLDLQKTRLLLEEERQIWIRKGEMENHEEDLEKRMFRAGFNGPQRRLLHEIIALRKNFSDLEEGACN
jgi:hypothetical protein